LFLRDALPVDEGFSTRVVPRHFVRLRTHRSIFFIVDKVLSYGFELIPHG